MSINNRADAIDAVIRSRAMYPGPNVKSCLKFATFIGIIGAIGGFFIAVGIAAPAAPGSALIEGLGAGFAVGFMIGLFCYGVAWRQMRRDQEEAQRREDDLMTTWDLNEGHISSQRVRIFISPTNRPHQSIN